MRESERIADELRRSVKGEAWHGPCVMEALEGVSAEMAAEHPVAGVHSIWEIMNHIAAWPSAVRRRALGTAVELKDDSDWPPVTDTSEAAWRATIEKFKRDNAELVATVLSLNEEDLARQVPNRDHDCAHMLFGMAHHHLYHAGQIQMLKRALEHRRGGR